MQLHIAPLWYAAKQKKLSQLEVAFRLRFSTSRIFDADNPRR